MLFIMLFETLCNFQDVLSAPAIIAYAVGQVFNYKDTAAADGTFIIA